MEWAEISHLGRKKTEEIQNKKLRNFIRQQLPYHPYYRELFKNLRIKLTDIQTTDDLAKIPLISKKDIAPYKNEPKKHLNFVLQPDAQLIKKYLPKYRLLNPCLKERLEFEYKPVHIHLTAGRTAAPTPFLYTSYDLELLKEAGRRMFDVFNISKEAIVVNAFPYAPHLAFWQTYYAALASRVISLNTGGGKILGTGGIINAVEQIKATTIPIMPGYCYHLLKEAKADFKDFSSVREVILGGERVPSGLKEKIRDLLISMGAKEPRVLSTYAFTEGKVAWPQCSEDSSYHLYPDLEFIEIIDKNGERCAEGEKGEIVYSALDFRGTVVLRYKTGDIGKLETEKCDFCSRTVPKISQDIERSSEFEELNLTKIKGTLVNLNQFFQLLMGNKDVDEWQVEIKKKGAYGLDELVLYIAPLPNTNIAELKVNIRKKIQASMELTPDIIIMDKSQLVEKLGMETELKEKRIVDKRKK